MRCLCGFEGSMLEISEHLNRMAEKGVICRDQVNEKYCAERNKLIPAAVVQADKLVPRPSDMTKDEREDYGHRWNEVYHSTMTQLWKEVNQ